MHKAIVFILFVLPFLCYSQFKYTSIYNPSWQYAMVDSSSAVELNPKKKKHAKFLFSIDSRNFYMSDQWVKMFGFKIGMEIRERYRWGFGAYELQEHIALDPIETKSGKTLKSTLTKFDYSTLFTEYLFHHNYRWTGGVMMAYGNGKADLHLEDIEAGRDSIIQITEIPIFAIDLYGYYHVTPWLAPGLGFGYRWVLGEGKNLRNGFNAPFYVVKVKFMLGRLYKTIFKNELIKAEKLEYKKEIEIKKAKRNAKTIETSTNGEGASAGED